MNSLDIKYLLHKPVKVIRGWPKRPIFRFFPYFLDDILEGTVTKLGEGIIEIRSAANRNSQTGHIHVINVHRILRISKEHDPQNGECYIIYIA